jgi:phage terminase large subunit-like protein
VTVLSAEAAAYLRGFDARLLGTSEGRRILTRLEPRLFALVYLRHHLAGAETGGLVSFSEAQLEWYDQARQWVRPIRQPKAWRRAYVAPRASAKSTTWFLLAPLWAAAHGHVRFVAAFADSAGQAEQHLSTLKHELDTNELLRKDFPELCRPATRSRGQLVSDNRALMQQASGFIFAARGVDSSNLGLKVGELRPDLLIFDDIEPDASNYSPALVEKRLATVQNALLPLNDWARVVLVGTVTMPGSLIHQLVSTVTSTAKPAAWVDEERFTCHYYPALLVNDDGTERSLWPEKWDLDYLLGIRHTRSFALNMMNQPVSADGLLWSADDIIVNDPGPDVLARCRHMLSVDPATTTKTSSDFTGLAVLSHDRTTGKVYVREAQHVKLTGAPLRRHCVGILTRYPEVTVIYCEVNQGGDLWADVFGDLPVKYVTVHQSVKKEVRAGWLLNGYQRRIVEHVTPQPALDAELLIFPRGLHDDMVDAVGTGYSALTGAGREKVSTLQRRVA